MEDLQLRVAGLIWGPEGVGTSLYVFRSKEGKWQLPVVAVPQEQSMQHALIVFLQEYGGLRRLGIGNLSFIMDTPVLLLEIRYAYFSGWRYLKPDLPNFAGNDVFFERRLVSIEELLEGGANELPAHDRGAIDLAIRRAGV